MSEAYFNITTAKALSIGTNGIAPSLDNGLIYITNTTDVAATGAFASVTVINNTFDVGDTLTVIFPDGSTYPMVFGVDITVGGSVSATAFNIADFFQNDSYLYTFFDATSLGATATITLKAAGTAGHRFMLQQFDQATNNITLSGQVIDSNTVAFTGANNNGLGFAFDTREQITDNDDRRLFSIRNMGREEFGLLPGGTIQLGTGTLGGGSTELYFRNLAPNVIRSEANLSIVLNNGGNTDIQFLITGSSGTIFQLQTDQPAIFRSQQTDGGGAETAFQLDTSASLTDPNSIHLELQNQGASIFKVGIDGTVYLSDGTGIIQGLQNGNGVILRSEVTVVANKLVTVINQADSLEKFSIGIEGAFNVRRRATAVSANSAGEFILAVTDTSSPRTITLDTDDEIAGRIIFIKDESGAAGTNAITIDTEGSSLIDGAASTSINTNYGSLKLYFNGTNWFSL